MTESVGSESLVIRQGNMAKIAKSLTMFDRMELKQTIDALYAHSESCGYATIPFESSEGDLGVILFCGYLERFRTISLLRHLRVGCVVAQDPIAPWFTGSAICGTVEQVLEMARIALPRARRWLLLGQSSGGYAALRASRLVSPSLTLAFAPQTFDDSAVKTRSIRWPTEFRYSQTINVGVPIQDLRPLFFRNPSRTESPCCIVSAFSEHGNPPTEWLWLDAMHWGRLVDHSDVTVFITPGNSHTVLFEAIDNYSELVAELASLDFTDREAILRSVDARVQIR